MSDTRNPDLDEAIAELSAVLQAMEQQALASGRSIDELIRKRKAYLIQATYDLLPRLSTRVLTTLREQVPGFVTREVQQCFDTQRKFLGVFASKDYAHALALLQTRLASYLDQHQHAGLPDRDAAIRQVSARRESLQGRRQTSLDLLALLRQAREQRAPLSPQLQEQVSRLASLARATRVTDDRPFFPERDPTQRSINEPARSMNDEPSPANRDNPLDLLFYWATDVSTSLRTLLIHTVDELRNDIDETRRDDPDPSGEPAGAPSSSSSEVAPSADTLAPAAVAAGVAAAAITGAVIATDDSLGLFS